jgi:bifunctional enzyme CysN/CysC
MGELLRLATAGSVDDGKSTLIGRLLYDSKAIFEDQLDALRRSTELRGEDGTNLALLTDGLRAEREQGITIDVAYRYFATPKRKFIIADTPGHVEYTRNMVTGASTAHLALILVDARKGMLEQSRRHAFLSSLLGIPHMVLCVNKMDLVDWSHERFEEIRAEFSQFAARMEVHDLSFIPVSALHGDNVVNRSDNSPWYEGPPLLHHLEEVYIASDENFMDPRFPVQYVIRPNTDEYHDFRGYAGTVASGIFRSGDEVVVLPTGSQSRIRSILTADGEVTEAFSPMAVTIVLEDELAVSRGDMLCRPNNRPKITQDLAATVCWMDDRAPLTVGEDYLIKHTTRTVRARVQSLPYRLDINTLSRDQDIDRLGLNEIGRVTLHTAQPLCIDDYQTHRATGSFIVIDPRTNVTVGAGMIRVLPGVGSASAVVRHEGKLTRELRAELLGVHGATVLLTGLSGSGKSTVAAAVEDRLVRRGQPAFLLDGDNLRLALCGDLGFSDQDRAENLRRVGEVARLFAESGTVALVALISPIAADRRAMRALHEDAGLPFLEVFVDTPLEVCEQRDPKGLYTRARAGEIPGFTGVDAPYEVPESPEIVLASDLTVSQQADRVIEALDALAGGAEAARR